MKRFRNVRMLQRLSSIGVAAAVAFAVLFTASCTDSTDPGVLSTLVVSPNPATVAAGATVQFTATGTDFTGASVTPNAGSVVWSVVAGGGTINSSTGLFTASTTPGTHTNTIVATCRGITARATVIVTAGPLATITVTPNPVTLAINVTQQFTAVGRDAFNNVVAITPVWSVVNGGGTINASGLFTAGTTPGTFANTVRATSGSISGSATVTVTVGPLATITVTPNPATLATGAQQQFTAVGRDAGGNVVPITPVFTATNPPGTINSSTGLFTAGNTSGTFANSVTATQGSISGSATVIVTAGPLTTIVVTPNPATLAIGAQQQFTAAGFDANGNVVAITPVFTATNPPGTINSSTGLFTAGNTTGAFPNSVTATQGTVSGSATVIVTAGPLATITVTPNPATVAVGAQQQFTATGRDAGGNVIPITPVFTATNPPGTINSSTGLFTAGTTTGTFANGVTATQGTISGSATVIVTAAAPPPPPPPVTTFRVLANNSVACTNGSITGDVGTLVAAPTGAITLISCPLSGGTAQTGTAASIAAYNSSVAAFTSTGTQPCGTVLTGTQAGAILAPGVYCFDAAATLTGVLTLNGAGTYLFKTGTSGIGGLTATNFSIVLAGGASACNVTFRSQDAATTTDSDFRGIILARQDITLTRGTLNGDAHSQGNVTITGTALTPCTP